MSEVNYRTVYIGDDEGEIEFCNFIKDGWDVFVDRFNRIQIHDGIVVIMKELKPKRIVEKTNHMDSKAYVDYYMSHHHMKG